MLFVLRQAEASLHAVLNEKVDKVIYKQHLLVLSELLEDLHFPHHQRLVDLIKTGFPLLGILTKSHIFITRDPGYVTPFQDFIARAPFLQRACKQSTRASGDHELDSTVWDETLNELKRGWLYVPVNESAVSTKFPLWISARRFGIRQKTKIRVIDDNSVFGHNDATSIPEKITLGSVDVVAVLLELLIPTLSNNSFSVALSNGTVLQGDVCPDWRREGLQLVVKCYDLKSAYKQWALAPFTEPFAVTSVWNPTESRPELFQQCALPFGARSSVHHFNWVGRMILHVMVSGLHMMSTSFFDDFPTVALNSEATSLAQCVKFFSALM